MGNNSSDEPDPDPTLPRPVFSLTPAKAGVNERESSKALMKLVLDIAATITMFVGLIPGVGIPARVAMVGYREGLKWFSSNNQMAIISALIDEKVEEGLARSVAASISAKMTTILNRIRRMESNTTTNEEKAAEVVPALTLCEEILQLFYDNDSCLRKAVFISTRLLVEFIVIYADVIMWTFLLRPSYGMHLFRELDKIIITLDQYTLTVSKERLKSVFVKFDPIGPVKFGKIYFVTIRGDGMWRGGCLGMFATLDSSGPTDYAYENRPFAGEEWRYEGSGRVRDEFDSNSVDLRINTYTCFRKYTEGLRRVYADPFHAIIEALHEVKRTVV